MVGARAPVPIRILIGQDGDVVLQDVPDAGWVEVAVGAIEVVDDVGDGDREEEGVGVVRVGRCHGAMVELVDDVAFGGVDVFKGGQVE